MLRGNPGHRSVNADEPKPEASKSEPPAWLDTEAKKEWKRIAPILRRVGILSEVDEDALATYCTTYARWKEAERKVVTMGMVVKAPGGYPIMSPYLSIANKAMAQCQRMLVEFGMTPSSRSRVTKVKSEEPAAGKSDHSRFFGGTSGA